jgi:gluconokinase
MTRATSPPAQVIVGLDAGTTGVKAVAFGLDAPWRRVVVREYPLLQPQPGWQVQDPETIGAASVDALAECVAAVGTAEVVAIALSAAMHGLVGLDAAMRTVTPLITWADSRAQGEARSLRTSGQAADLHRRTGVPVHPMSPLTKLMWMSRNDPTACASARWWVGLKDYLLWSLTGTLATELSSASGSGLLDMATRSWSPTAVDLAGIAVDQLPPIEPTTATLPLAAEPAARVELSAGPPVVLGAADGPLGNLGTALGAAALGLYALGREDRLADAVARLRDPDESPADEVDPDPVLVATYERVRRSVPEHLTALAAVVALFSDDRERHDEPLASGPSTPASLGPSDRE